MSNGDDRSKFEALFKTFAETAEAGMDGLSAKHLSLLINAIAGKRLCSGLMTKAAQRVLSVGATLPSSGKARAEMPGEGGKEGERLLLTMRL